MKRVFSSGLLAVMLMACMLVLTAGSPQQSDYDLVIKNGKVFDGTGNPAFYADIAIRDDRIVRVGRLDQPSADRVIDAEGLHVAPGFIDVHSHAGRRLDSDDERARAAPSLITQGVTTVAVNHDGRSPWPLTPQMQTYEELGTGLNTMHMVGHGQIRSEVLGDDARRTSTDEEIEQMQALVREAMQQGAYGMSVSLEYAPGRWADTDEMVAVTREIEPYNGVYISHQRSEGSDPMWYWPSQHEPGPPNLLDSVLETIEVGERTGATVVASHIKAKGAHYWGSSHAAINLIQRARDRGVDIWADQYSYRSTGTDGRTVLIPSWLFNEMSDSDENYAALLERLLEDPDLSEKIRKDIAHEIQRRGGPGDLIILQHPNEEYEGMTFGELAEQYEHDPVDMAIHMQLEGNPDRRGGARMRGLSMSEDDIEAYMKQPWTMAASDAGIGVAEDDEGFVHARFYGNFPRKISEYAMERGVITVADAIRSGTSLPARVMGLSDRGMVEEGYKADLIIMDLENVEDKATFHEPHQYSEGMEYVMVNGTFVVDEGEKTWELPGRVLHNTKADDQ